MQSPRFRSTSLVRSEFQSTGRADGRDGHGDVLGEGVLNGLLTARVGLSVMAACRPTPFSSGCASGISDVAPFLFKSEPKG
jgi:hypothetical protein